MANLANAKLNIEIHLPKKQATVSVTCDVYFVQAELDMMKDGQGYTLTCKLWGKDNGQNALVDPDDELGVAFDPIYYPDVSPNLVEHASFQKTVRLRALNEDSGRDEVYSQLTIKDHIYETKKKIRTNTVKYEFVP